MGFWRQVFRRAVRCLLSPSFLFFSLSLSGNRSLELVLSLFFLLCLLEATVPHTLSPLVTTSGSAPYAGPFHGMTGDRPGLCRSWEEETKRRYDSEAVSTVAKWAEAWATCSGMTQEHWQKGDGVVWEEGAVWRQVDLLGGA